MRSGFIVIAICLVISSVIAFQQYRAFKTDLVASQDLVLGLLYFMEAHHRMPASEQEFRASPFVEAQPDGTLKVVPPAESRFSRTPHGYPLRELDSFRIAWGQDLAELKPDEYGRLFAPDHRTVELIRWPSSGDSGKVYSILLYDEWRRLQESQ